METTSFVGGAARGDDNLCYDTTNSENEELVRDAECHGTAAEQHRWRGVLLNFLRRYWKGLVIVGVPLALIPLAVGTTVSFCESISDKGFQ